MNSHHPTLAATATAILLLLAAHSGVPPVDGVGLMCYNCSNWDNRTDCLDTERHATIMVCDKSLEVGKLQSMCFIEVVDECQPTVYKSAADVVGNGGAIMKRYVRAGCTLVVPSDPEWARYRDCYWERVRGGRDLLHQTSGFQVIGRSYIRRYCHCPGDTCNYLEAPTCENYPGNLDLCGPNCKQASRDQLKTPGVAAELHRDGCPISRWADKAADVGVVREWDDCGQDPHMLRAKAVGGLRYRHVGLFGGKVDGVREKWVVKASACDAVPGRILVCVVIMRHVCYNVWGYGGICMNC